MEKPCLFDMMETHPELVDLNYLRNSDSYIEKEYSSNFGNNALSIWYNHWNKNPELIQELFCRSILHPQNIFEGVTLFMGHEDVYSKLSYDNITQKIVQNFIEMNNSDDDKLKIIQNIKNDIQKDASVYSIFSIILLKWNGQYKNPIIATNAFFSHLHKELNQKLMGDNFLNKEHLVEHQNKKPHL